MVRLDSPVPLVHKDNQDCVVNSVLTVGVVLPEITESQDFLDQKERSDLKDPQDVQEHQDVLALMEWKENRERQVRWVRPEFRETKARRVYLVRMDWMVRQVSLDLRESTENQGEKEEGDKGWEQHDGIKDFRDVTKPSFQNEAYYCEFT